MNELGNFKIEAVSILLSDLKGFTYFSEMNSTLKVATPVNWQDGDKVIIVPSVSDDEASDIYPKGWETVKPYLRLVDQPK